MPAASITRASATDKFGPTAVIRSAVTRTSAHSWSPTLGSRLSSKPPLNNVRLDVLGLDMTGPPSSRGPAKNHDPFSIQAHAHVLLRLLTPPDRRREARQQWRW